MTLYSGPMPILVPTAIVEIFINIQEGERLRKMKETSKKEKTEALTRLLKRINHGADPKLLRKEATNLLSKINPGDIACAEQNLIEDGFSARLVQQLSAAFVLMGIIEEQSKNIKVNLADNHVMRRVMAEHELMRCFLADLRDIEKAIAKMTHLTDTSAEFRRLCHIVEHLEAMEEHIAREEDVIFPFLRKHGWASLCRSARSDHVYLRVAVDDLLRLVHTYEPRELKEFRAKLSSIVQYLVPTMVEHLMQEDEILYPIALEVVDDDKLWEKMKTVCDDIGYCGVHI